MVADVPVVLYNKSDDKEPKHTKKEFDDIMTKWNERKKQEEEQGTRVDLNDFLTGSNTK